MADSTASAPDQHPPVAHRPAKERMVTLDALRGFALLGILVPNMVTFAWPMAAMADPSVMGPDPWNRWGYNVTATVFLGKFMFLFALLFGAGVVLYDRKTAPRGGAFCGGCGYDRAGLPPGTACPECGSHITQARKPKLTDGAWLWHRRCLVLLGLGLVHAYFFWYGDILTFYALAGVTLLWWVRRLPVAVQIWGGLGVYVAGALLLFGFMLLGLWAVHAGHAEPDEMMGDPVAETAAYLGSWSDALRFRAVQTFTFQLMFGIFFLPALWGLMTLGMGLTRAGILTGERSVRFHATLGVSLTALGLALTFAVFAWVQTLTDMPGFVWQGMAQIVGVPLAIGYSQLVVTAARLPALAGVTRAFANVGRMALTNYLMHTVVCTTIMYGYGLGRFGSIEYPALFGLIGAVWIANFAFSALWLRYFAYGPMEWLWRQATYLGFSTKGDSSR